VLIIVASFAFVYKRLMLYSISSVYILMLPAV